MTTPSPVSAAALDAFLARHRPAGAPSPAVVGRYRADAAARLLVVSGAGGDVLAVVALQARTSLAEGRRVAEVDAVVGPDGSVNAAPVRSAVERAAAELGCTGVTGVLSMPIGDGDGVADRFVRTACAAAEEIVGLVEGLRHEPDVGMGADGAPTKAADRAAETCAIDHLGRLGVPICSEERGHVGGTPDPEGRWIAIDPIDGTRNFLRGLPPYGFAAALVDAGEPVAGVVVDLTSGRRWIGRAGEGSTVDGEPCTPRSGGPIAVPSLAPGESTGTLPAGHSRVRMSGSTTIDLCRVADGSLGAFVDLQRRVVHVHDLAAPLVVLREAGVPVTTGAGEAPQLPPDPRWTTSLLVGAPAAAVVAG
ncbi:MAG: inositol monophosphatase [Actinomycetota bacterium]